MAEKVVGYTFEGLDELLGKLRPEIAAAPVNRFLNRSGAVVQSNAKDNALRSANIGTLRRSIAYRVDTRTPLPLSVEIGPNVDYARYVEFGRGKGKMPPVSAIEKWYRRKAGLGMRRVAVGQGEDRQTINSIATNIARAIGKRGTKAQPYLVPALQDSETRIEGFVTVLRLELEEAYQNAK